MTMKRPYLSGLILFLIVLFSSASAEALEIHRWDFENPSPLGPYTVSNGTWQGGTPTTPPNACNQVYGGVSCAGTVLNGNYTDNVDSRLESPAIFLPNVAAGEEIHVKYWEWFAYAANDTGIFEIGEPDPTAPGGWAFTPVAGDNTVWSVSNIWSPKDVDLTSYAGKTIKIAFHHQSRTDQFGRVYVNAGWFVDDIIVETIAAPALFTGEDFEAGWGDWFTNRGTWEVGPNATCHGGPNPDGTLKQCAGTVHAGNYSDNMDSLLTTRSVVLPSVGAGEELHLRYWEWFAYAANDNGFVEISELINQTTGEWSAFTRVDPGNHVYSVSNVWSRKDLDLTAYAGKTIKIAFHHQSRTDQFGRAYVSAGWFIDDITLVTNVPLVPPPFVIQDFELGWEDWFTNRGTWEVGTPTVGPPSCKTGNQCAGTVIAGNYSDNMDSFLTSRSITLPPVSGGRLLQLRFWQWYSYNANDSGIIEISEQDPETGEWPAFTPIPGFNAVVGVSNGWTEPPPIDLTAYAGKTVRIAFHHQSRTDRFGRAYVSPGWYIDNARVAISPVAVAGGPYSGGEGSLIPLDGSRSFDPDGNITTYDWDLNGDGVFETRGNPVNFDATNIDGPAGPFTVSLRVTDNDFLTNIISTTVTVNNVAPTADAGGPYNGKCNTPIPLSGSAADPAPADILTYAWDFNGDGVFGDAADRAIGDPTIPSPTVTYPAAGVYTVALQVTDDDGGLGTSPTTTVTVICPPTADPTDPAGPYTVPEGGSTTLNGSASFDEDGTIVLYEWDYFDDGTIDATGPNPVFDAALIDGSELGTIVLVTLKVTDDDGEFDVSNFTTIEVTNVPPTANANGPYDGFCFQPVPLVGSGSDPAPADIPTLAFDWDLDGDGVYETPGQIVDVTYDAVGVYPVELRVTDDDAGFGTDPTTVTITCPPPVSNPGGQYVVPEGGSTTLDGSASFDEDGTIVLYEWDYFDDGTIDATGANPIFDAALIDGTEAGTVVAVSLRVTDNLGLTGTAGTTVTVTNVAPTANGGGPYTGAPDEPIILGGTATDPAPADTYTCAWDVNHPDPNVSDGVFEVVGCNASISFPLEGVYTIWLQVTDDDGGVSDPVSSADVTALGCGLPHWNTPAASPGPMHLAGGLDFVISGRQAQNCDEVAVFDSGGQLIGADLITQVGIYGDMVVNGDSPNTPNTDEGAPEGDLLTVRIWDSLSQTEYQSSNNIRLQAPISPIVNGYIAYEAPLTFVSNLFVQMDLEVHPGCDVPLVTGWNLFGWTCDGGSYDGVQPPPLTDYTSGSYLARSLMDEALASLGLTPGSYLVAVGPGGKVYVDGSPFNNLKTLLPGFAYWVYANADSTLTLPGSMLAPTETLELPNAGWNQVAYWGIDGLAPGDAFRCIDGLYDVITDPNGKVYIPTSPFNTLNSVNHIDGYYLHTTGPATLTYGCP